MTTPVTPQSSRRRLHAADTAKGIAIVFVVFGHAWRGVFGAGLLQDEALFTRVDSLIYAWHMPFFFFLSGLHFLGVAQREAPSPFVLSRIRRLLWPMALWTWLFYVLKMGAGGAANTPVALSDFPLIPLPPYEHLWFLWALFLAQIAIFAVIYPVRQKLESSTIRWGLAGLALILTAVFSVTYFPSELFGLAFVHLPYFLAGVAFGRLSENRPSLWVALAAGLGTVGFFYMVTLGYPRVPVSLMLVLLVWLVIAFVDREDPQPSVIIGALRYLGQASLAIYLIHTIFSAALRIGLVSIGINSVPLHLALATLVGLLGPIGVLWCAQRWHMTKALGLY